jgi:uncharacterized membrane protein YqjE
MAGPEATGSGASPSLFASLRSFWSVLVAILYTRLDLATAELEDEAHRAIKLLIFGLLSVLCLFMAFFFAMFFLIAMAWETDYQFWVIGGIFGIYFVTGVGLFFAARDMIVNRPRFLSQTLAELRRDVDGLNRAAAAKKDEDKT